MKRSAGAILVAMTLLGGGPLAPRGGSGQPTRRTYVDDGDGNRVESVAPTSLERSFVAAPPRDGSPFSNLDFWFLGRGWGEEKNATLKRELLERHLQAIAYSPQYQSLNPTAARGQGFPFQVCDFPDLEARAEVTDVDVRLALEASLKAREGSRWQAATLNVVLLCPRLYGRMGELRSGTDFACYFRTLETEQGTLNYLVVAGSGKADAIREAAVRGILLMATRRPPESAE